MRLKAKIVFGTALLMSVSAAMPSVGAVRGKVKAGSVFTSGSTVLESRVAAKHEKAGKEYAKKTKRNLCGKEARDSIECLSKLTPRERDDLRNRRETIWTILVAKSQWYAIRCLLGTDGRGKLDKNIVDVYRRGFVACFRRIRCLKTPLDVAVENGTVSQLRACIPSDLPENLKCRLPDVLIIHL